MKDNTALKVDSNYSPIGELGQKYLVSGKSISMRLWERLSPRTRQLPSSRDYETVGYVVKGSAKLHFDDQVISLRPGNSWLVPKHARHWYEILEPFTAIEATAPPAEVHGRDEAH